MSKQDPNAKVPHYAADGTLRHYCSNGRCPDISVGALVIGDTRAERRADAEARTSFVVAIDDGDTPQEAQQ